jgi:hypothetical protein
MIPDTIHPAKLEMMANVIRRVSPAGSIGCVLILVLMIPACKRRSFSKNK